jgi:predicted nucleic acid-binding protein
MTFVDTSALYALLDRDDLNHGCAKEKWIKLLDGGEPLFTTNYVVVELFALCQRRIGFDAVRALQEDVLPVIEVQWIGEEDHKLAVTALLATGRRKLSLVDCASFSAMRKVSSRAAFAFDEHFVEQGLTLA